jgi:hypothetical protein
MSYGLTICPEADEVKRLASEFRLLFFSLSFLCLFRLLHQEICSTSVSGLSLFFLLNSVFNQACFFTLLPVSPDAYFVSSAIARF